MNEVKKNLDIFKQFNDLQSKIDQCNCLISLLKEKRTNDRYYLSMNFRDNLGEYLTDKIGKDIIKLLEAEIVKLNAEQEKLQLQ